MPVAIRQVILRRALKEGWQTVFAADRPLRDVLTAGQEETARRRADARLRGVTDRNELKAVKGNIRMVVVPSGDGSADDWLVENLSLPALCITHDIPLASRLCAKGAVVLDDRGGVWTKETIAPRLLGRDINTELRFQGIQNEKAKPMGQAQVKAFSDAFDRTIAKIAKNSAHPL